MKFKVNIPGNKIGVSLIEETRFYALKNSKGQYLSNTSWGGKSRWTKDITKAFVSKINTTLYWKPKPSQEIVAIIDETIITRREV